MKCMTDLRDKEQRFIELTDAYKDVVAKVCYFYASPSAGFDDLYQEVLINLWQGMDSFRGEAKISTWIYRIAINTCITWHRRNNRHSKGAVSIDSMPFDPVDASSADTAARMENYRILQKLISRLEGIDKALVMMWLDEKSYDEIAAVTGIKAGNVAVRLHRIRERLARMASADGESIQ